jgi:tetratricopeptide (TPR) repeat protein
MKNREPQSTQSKMRLAEFFLVRRNPDLVSSEPRKILNPAHLILLCVLCGHLGCAPQQHEAAKPTPVDDAAWGAFLDGKMDALGESGDVRARYGRALAEHERGEPAEAWRRWYGLLADGAKLAGDARWPMVAVAAARRLDTLGGEVGPDSELKPVEKLAALDVRPLPLEARRRIFALRASYARRAGDESAAREMDRDAGCAAQLRVSGPYGKLPRLDLDRPFPPESGEGAWRIAPARACQVVLDGPVARQGVIYGEELVRAKHDQRALVVVETELPWRLYIDGQLKFVQADPDRFAPRVRELVVELPAGWHRLLLKAAAQGGRADVSLAAFADPPLEFSTEPHSTRGKTAVKLLARARLGGDPFAALMAIEHALAFGDGEEAELAVETLQSRAPRFALGWLMAAQAALDDATRPQNIAQDRARRSLERALSLDPRLRRARYLRALMALNAERPREALGWLEEQKTKDWRFSFARYQAWKARGWLREAEEALDEARKLNPSACPALEAAVQLRRERHDVAALLPLAKQASTCNGGNDDFAEALRESGDLRGAIAEYRRLAALDAGREAFRAGLAETLAQAGELKDAAALLEALIAHSPRATHWRRELADVRVALGDERGARKVIEEGMAETPESQELARALEALCAGPLPAGQGGLQWRQRCGPIDPFRVDGKQVIADYEREAKQRAAYTSPAVIVLDRTVTRVFSTGARLTLTHNIIQVLAKDGIDKWGEVQIPPGADVLTLRAVKADGTTREPEEISEKESISVPDLEPGDYVEFEYVDPAPPPGAFPGGFIAERFFFRSFDAPLDRTEYVLVTPRDMKLQIDRRGEAPESKAETRDALAIRTWAGRFKPQAFQEPAAAPFSETLPSVRAASGVSFPAWRDYLRDGEWFAQRSSLELARLAREITKDQPTPQKRAEAIDAWARKHVRPGGPLDEPATFVLARGEGNRVTIEAALLRAAGVPSEIWLARPAQAAQLDGPLPDLEAFDQPLLRVLAPKPFIIDPRYRHSPTGFVAPTLRGASALRLAAAADKLATVESGSPDDRHMRMRAQLGADGSAEVIVREELRGWPAVEWREALEKLAPDRVRPEFEQRTLGFYFPGSTLSDLAWRGQDDDDGPFTVEYKFRSPQLARRVGQALVFPAPYPAMLGRRYVGVAARRTPLSLDYASPTALEAEVAVPQGLTVELPPAVKADGFGVFEQEAARTAAGFRLKARFAMPRSRVQPERYREFVDFAIRVDRAEARAAELKPHD